MDELRWDPKVDDKEIATSVSSGNVTLRGTVGTFGQRKAAQDAAQRVYGVMAVDNQLSVRILDGAGRDDAELRGSILQALMLDSLVPATVDAQTTDGRVTLSGTAEWQYQRSEAEDVASRVPGVVQVIDEIEVESPTPFAGSVKSDIEQAIERSAKLDAEALSVRTSNGIVTIEGSVNSWAEHDEAISAAWAAPGVKDVDDRVSVVY
jgi:osmotically-inducible protein OsmY